MPYGEGDRLGVAISGGGHRATVWGWGALLALTDMGVNDRVTSIASVSGGSIANGVVANAGDYTSMSSTEFEAAIADGLRVASREGLFFFGPPTDGYVTRFAAAAGLTVGSVVAMLVSLTAAGREWEVLPWAVIGVVLALLGWLATRPKASGPVLPTRIRYAAIVSLLVAGPITVAFAALTTGADGWSVAGSITVVIAITLVIAWSTLRLFSQRSVVVDRALGGGLLARGGRPALLRDVDHNVHHVFCMTELQSGDHAYLTPRLVYGYRLGRGTPGELALSTAVQSSACLPGAFVPRVIPTGGFDLQRTWDLDDGQPPAPPTSIVVSDGGVYDNMADQWEQGHASRTRRLADLPTMQPGADTLIVVNASGGLGWTTLGKTRRLGAEVRSLSRTIDILYDVSTSHRRQGLIARFNAADDLRGALVHITQSPFRVPSAFAGSPDEGQRRRAAEASAFLDGLGADADRWRARAAASAGVATTLAALGPATTADLLEHAYLLTRINVYVVLGIGALPNDPAVCARARFDALAGSVS